MFDQYNPKSGYSFNTQDEQGVPTRSAAFFFFFFSKLKLIEPTELRCSFTRDATVARAPGGNTQTPLWIDLLGAISSPIQALVLGFVDRKAPDFSGEAVSKE